ncbi:MAG: insulinase family protein, partial [Akkermansiaceae bacterium]|nr:insulinase family protein [Akkermansiaceae bacterium]
MRKSVLLLVILLGLAAVGFLILTKGEPDTRPPTVKTDASVKEADPEPWPQESSDIPPDPEVRFGALENGLRYMIRANPEPPGRLALRLHVDAGSLMEDDSQRGLAHFLEHMVFNGSKNFTPDELIPKMQRLGIAFGAHANAYTSFDETVYMLDLPNTEPDTLDLAFTVMRDFADGALLKPEEIDKERGVILSEKTSRDSVQRRLMEQQFEFLLPDHLVTHRFPIGVEEVITGAPRERFVDFYTRYYIPQQITFVAVGDLEPDVMEERIKEAFSTMANPANPGSDPDLGPIPSGTGFRTAIFTDKEVTSDELSLLTIRPHERKPDTEAVRLDRMPLTLAHAILERRFEILAKKEGSPISTGGAGRSVWFKAIEFGSIDVTPGEDRWRDAVTVLEQEFRRAREHGFTEAELAEVKAKTLNRYEQLVKRAPTRKSDGRGGLASQLSNTVNDEQVFSTPEENLRIVRKGLEAMTPEILHEAFSQFWQTPDLALILTTKEAGENAEEELAALYEESASVPVAPPEEAGAQEFAYTDFGPPGTVVSDTTHEDLGIRQLVLSNNVRVNLKPTDFEKNSIRIVARFGSGKLGLPQDKTGLDTFTSMVMNTGGLGKHSADELQRVLAGKNVGAALAVGENAFTISGRTTPEDLELQLQLMAAGFTDPGYR